MPDTPPPKRRTLGLRGKYVLLLACGMAAISVTLILNTVYAQRLLLENKIDELRSRLARAVHTRQMSTLTDALRNDGLSLARRVAEAALGGDADPKTALDSFVKETQAARDDKEDLVYLVVRDAKGNSVYSFHGPLHDAVLESKAKAGPGGITEVKDPESGKQVAVLPCIHAAGTDAERKGNVFLGLNTQGITEQIRGLAFDPEVEDALNSLQTSWREDTDRAAMRSWLLAAGLLVLGTALASLLAARITGPLRELERVASDIESKWDLTRRAPVRTRDEVGQLATVLNRMVDGLARLVRNIQESSVHLGSASSELVAAAGEIARGSKSQEKALEDTSSAVTELSASVRQLAGNARRAAETAVQGGESAQRAVESMGRIRGSVEETRDRVRSLGENSKEIGKIVAVITQISDQTSLLALNAAIEAARAGEHGRGFAVVAEEVGKLAERCQRSAKEIEERVTQIKDRTDETVVAMQGMTKEVESGSERVNAAGRNFTEIVDVVQETAAAVEEQSKATQSIAGTMSEVLSIAKETVGATDEAVAQGADLRDLAMKMDVMVKQFRTQAGVEATVEGAGKT